MPSASLPGGLALVRLGTRERNLYDPSSRVPYRLSRSKIELFLRCARCFSLDRRRGVGRPEGVTMSLNTAVDALIKREFDLLRRRSEPHPAMARQGIDALPWNHPALDEWRDNARGVRVLHPETNFLVHGAVDDIWITPKGDLVVVDYKAMSSERGPSLGGPWSQGYKRQVEVYQWLLRGLGYAVSSTAYFVFANGDRGRETFDGRLEFTTTILPYVGSDAWVEDALHEAKLCLDREGLPPAHPECEWCAYRAAALAAERGAG